MGQVSPLCGRTALSLGTLQSPREGSRRKPGWDLPSPPPAPHCSSHRASPTGILLQTHTPSPLPGAIGASPTHVGTPYLQVACTPGYPAGTPLSSPAGPEQAPSQQSAYIPPRVTGFPARSHTGKMPRVPAPVSEKGREGSYHSWRDCIRASLLSDGHGDRRGGSRRGGGRGRRWHAAGAGLVRPPDHVAVTTAQGIIAVTSEVGLLVNDGSCERKGQVAVSGTLLGGEPQPRVGLLGATSTPGVDLGGGLPAQK